MTAKTVFGIATLSSLLLLADLGARPAGDGFRALGPRGLDQFLDAHRGELEPGRAPREELAREMDAVCKQRDCWASHLYWHTDLDAAKEQARDERKPILSLRLLGNLDEDLTCANSRFFRTVLYANAEVSAYLRDHYVLHWESVRPVPKVTIDMGDGRTLVRTLTGNSIHWVLDADGRPVDALPGLYAPAAFLRALRAAEPVARQSAAAAAPARAQILAAYHEARLRAAASAWTLDVARLPAGTAAPAAPEAALGALQGQIRLAPAVLAANVLPTSKMAVERPLARSVLALDARALLDPLARASREMWDAIAALHEGDARLDAGSLALMRAKTGLDGEPLARMAASLERAVALECARGDLLLRSRVHAWLRAAPADDVRALNDRVYSELFLTPPSDPWIGLVTPDAYPAIDANGVGGAVPYPR